MQHLKIFLISFFPDFQKRLKFPWFEVKLPDFSLTLKKLYSLTCGNHVIVLIIIITIII